MRSSMQRRQFLKSTAGLGAGLAGSHAGLSVALGQAQDRERIILGGYAPAESSFGQGLDLIGQRLEARFGDSIDVHYVYNVIDIGFAAGGELRWLVDSGLVTLGYLSMSTGIPELEVANLEIRLRRERSDATQKIRRFELLGEDVRQHVELPVEPPEVVPQLR